MLLVLLVLILTVNSHAQVSVTTWHNNLARTGENREETILTPENVRPDWFGKIFSHPVDGKIFAQPLYMPALAIPGKGVHNVVFVATARNTVYAFDADSASGENALPLWRVTLLDAAAGETPVSVDDIAGCRTITPELGITGTPVIDPSTNTLYTVAMSSRQGSITHRLHALDVATGRERSGSPVVIDASVPGNGDFFSPNRIKFQPYLYKNRAGLLLLNGVIYTSWASHCDAGAYHGWILGYDARDLHQVVVFNATPNGDRGSFWMGGAAPAADADGNIYAISGNGKFDEAASNFGNSFIKLSPQGLLAAFFTPFNQLQLDRSDLDLGSSAALLLPDIVGSAAHRRLLVSASKEGCIYLLDRDQMGRFRATDDSQAVQSLKGAVNAVYGSAAYFNSTLYFAASADALKAFPIGDGRIGAAPTSRSSQVFDYPGAIPAITANGSSNGIVWLVEIAFGGTLRAYDASNVARELYNSQMNSGRDALGSFVRFSVPTIANGKVYVGTGNSLAIFGLLLPQPLPSAIVNAASFTAGPVAPGSLISIFGENLARTAMFAPDGPLPLSLGGLTLSINGVAAPLLFVSPGQINAQVPFGLAIGPAIAVLQSADAPPVAIPFSIASAAPGIFAIQGAVWNADGSINTPENPAAVGSVITVYLTGLGSVDVLGRPIQPLTATLGGQTATIALAQLSPVSAGLFEVHLLVPATGAGGHVLTISANGAASNTALVSVMQP